MKSYIYGLFDSTGCRYIGKSVKPKHRYAEHLTSSALAKDSYKTRWLNKLIANNQYPEMIILEECPSDAVALECEVWWISFGKRIGWRLTNATDGGEGTTGWHHNEETRKKISVANKGKQNSLGRTLTEEQKATISTRMLGNTCGLGSKRSIEHCQKQSLLFKGRKHTDETKKLISLVQIGKVHSEKTKAKMRLAQQQRRMREQNGN